VCINPMLMLSRPGGERAYRRIAGWELHKVTYEWSLFDHIKELARIG